MQLTKERITKKALDIIDEHGLDALSMRRLGRELEVDAKSMYHYFPNKDALIIGVLETAFSKLNLPKQLAGSWKEQMRKIVWEYYRLTSHHPNLVPLLSRFDGSIPLVLEIAERIVVALYDTGLSPRRIIQIVHLVEGSIGVSALTATMAQSELEDIYQRITALPDEDFPAIKALQEKVTIKDMESDWSFHLEVLLMGIEQLIQRETETSD